MTIAAIEPAEFPWFDYGRYSFSLGLSAGKRAFLSGHSASEFDPDTKRMVVRGGMADQARTAYAKIESILDAAGFGLEDVVRLVENVTRTGIDHYADADRVRSEVLGATAPAVNTVVVRELLRPDALIEIEATAARNGKSISVDGAGRAAAAPAHSADGIVYLSTIHPYDEHGELVGEGDVVEQTRQIFRNAERILAACGLTMANVVNTLEMVRPEGLADYKYTGRVRKEYLGPVYPAAAGIIQDRVAADDRVLLSYDFIASTYEPEAISTGYARYEKLSYSPAVRAGNLLFLSGQAALDPETERAVHAGDVVAQTEYTYRNLISVLEAAGLGPEHFLKTVEFVTPRGLADYRGTAAVRKDLLQVPYPAATGVLCHSLLRPEFDIEIVSMALFPDES